MISFNPLRRQWAEVHGDALRVFEAMGADSQWVLGRRVQEFESSLAKTCKIPYAVGTGNGLDAIEICLRSLGIAAGDKVLTTPLSAFATTLAILHTGAIPVFVDVDAEGLIDLSLCEEALKDDSSIRFLVPVHLYGRVLDLRHLKKIREAFPIRVVEDCAQAIGGSYDGLAAGSVSPMAAFSFYPSKNLGAFGDGGAILTDDSGLAEKARQIRNYGQQEKYLHVSYGINSRLDELQAGFLNDVLLPRLPAWTQKRAQWAQRYRVELNGSGVVPLQGSSIDHSVWHLFPVLVQGSREGFQSHMASHGIETALHYPRLIPDQPVMKTHRFEIRGRLDQAIRIAAQEVSLPLHPWLKEEEIEQVINACRLWKP